MPIWILTHPHNSSNVTPAPPDKDNNPNPLIWRMFYNKFVLVVPLICVTLWPVIRYNSFFNRSIGWWGLRVEGYLTLHNRRVGWVYCIYSFILYLYIFRVSLREDVRRVKEEWRIPGSAWAACSEGERHRGAAAALLAVIPSSNGAAVLVEQTLGRSSQ